MKKINILTGPVKSGKTTRLIAWIKFHQQCAGILSPVIDEQRYLYSILANEYRKLEADIGTVTERDLVEIGKYSFLESTFNWGKEELQLAVENNPQYLVIDEIGPLELSGRGLEPMVTFIFKTYARNPKNRLILVVRDHLLEKVISHYDLPDKIVIDHHFLSIP